MSVYRSFLVALGLLFACLSLPASAYINNHIDEQSLVFHCPAKVSCSGEREKGTLACTGEGVDSKYWALYDTSKQLRAGNYDLIGFTPNSDVTNKFGMSCQYKYSDSYPFPVDDLIMTTEYGAHVTVDGTGVIPLGADIKETPGILIATYLANKNFSMNSNLLQEVYINGIKVNGDIGSNDQFTYLSYDTLIADCGSVSQCKVYVRNKSDMSDNYGEITIEFTHGVNITRVNSPAAIPSNGYTAGTGVTYKIIKHPLFNSVMMMRNN